MPHKPRTQEQKDERAAQRTAEKEADAAMEQAKREAAEAKEAAEEAKRLARNARERQNYHKRNQVVPSGAVIQQGNGRSDLSMAGIMNMTAGEAFALGASRAGVSNIGIHIGGTVIGSVGSYVHGDSITTTSSTNNDASKVTNADLMEAMKELKSGQQKASLQVQGVERTVRKATKAWDPPRVNSSYATPLGQSLKANVEFSPAARPKSLFNAENGKENTLRCHPLFYFVFCNVPNYFVFRSRLQTLLPRMLVLPLVQRWMKRM